MNEEIITYNDLVAGAIQLGTAFNEGVDANQIAADLLAERFSAVAESSMSAGEAVDMLTGRITDQSLTIEEAVIELNRLRAAAGQAQLSLADFTLDPDRVIAQVRVITGSLIDLDQFTESLKQGLRQALQNEVALDFEAGVRAAIGEALFRGLIGAVTTLAGAEFLGPLLDQVNRLITQFVTGNLDADAFSSGVDTVLDSFDTEIRQLEESFAGLGEVWERLRERFGLGGQELDGAVESAGMIADEFERAAQALNTALRQLDQLGQIGVLSPDEVATGRRDLLAEPLVSTGPDSAAEDLARASQQLDTLVDAEINLFNVRKRGIEEQLRTATTGARAQSQQRIASIRRESQARIEAARQRSQARVAALQEEIAANESLLQTARSFAQVTTQIRGTINSVATGPGSTLAPQEQFSLFGRQAAGLRQQLAGAAPEDQPALLQRLAQTLQSQISTSPFPAGDYRRQVVFRNIVQELERLERLASDGASDIDRIEAALEDNRQQVETENQALRDTITMENQALGDRIAAENQAIVSRIASLEASATAAIDILREQTHQTLQDIWAQQRELDMRRNELLEGISADDDETSDERVNRISGPPTVPTNRRTGGDSPIPGTRGDDLISGPPTVPTDRRTTIVNVNIDRRGSRTSLAEAREQDRRTQRIVRQEIDR